MWSAFSPWPTCARACCARPWPRGSRGWPEPWWVTAHGSFQNGVVFEITQGFTYGQLARDKTENCGLEALGTLGLVRMRHDFQTVQIDYHGVETTAHNSGPYGGKKLDV